MPITANTLDYNYSNRVEQFPRRNQFNPIRNKKVAKIFFRELDNLVHLPTSEYRTYIYV